MKVHFIAVGGSAMHNLAIALSRKGNQVSGSDDEILDPSKSRLEREGILPNEIGWFPEKITNDLDAVILGMHAREDNPELLRAKELNIPVFSYPEYLYEASKTKKRVVIAGSHGKTTITSMILHVAKKMNVNVDYMVGAQLEGYDCMVKISEDAPCMILEGDEYLSSPIDRRPKFHLYKPHIALISGIAWDHINVFPTFENYVDQFKIFMETLEENGALIYNCNDRSLTQLVNELSNEMVKRPYTIPEYKVLDEGVELVHNGEIFSLKIFGDHNLQNLWGASLVGLEMGIAQEDFFEAMKDFRGAGKRLQAVIDVPYFKMFKDFAHSPSKLKATTEAVKKQFPHLKVIACMELHTFSSLKKEFLPHYLGSMAAADEAIVYFNPHVVEHKKLAMISKEDVARGFGGKIAVANRTDEVLHFIDHQLCLNSVLLMMSSGNFDGIDFDNLGSDIEARLAFSK
ncbi:MAG: peptidoglycan synthetase [Bacteroidetes bacterium]|nr:peptidoglycan synthetase [Bacteroidota bacterium]MBM3424375.1 peptidoglycan synthetase [Bacteroidota bacterium]